MKTQYTIQELADRISVLEADRDILEAAVRDRMGEVESMVVNAAATKDVAGFIRRAAELARKNMSVPVKSKPTFTDDIGDDVAQGNRDSRKGHGVETDADDADTQKFFKGKVQEAMLAENVSKKHFVHAAKMISAIQNPQHRKLVADHFHQFFATHSSSYQPDRFYHAAGVDRGGADRKQVQENMSPLLEHVVAITRGSKGAA